MNKGFTLVELIAVIVVLSIISLIVVPIIQDSMESSNEKSYNITVNEIKNATKLYAAENVEQFITGDTFEVSISTLCTDKYLTCPITNPITGDTMNGSVIIARNSNNEFEYTYQE